MSIVTIEHFDRGIITTLGGVLVDVIEDGGPRKHYAIDFAGVVGPDRYAGKVPVFMVSGHTAYTPKHYPCVLVRRQGLAPALENGGAPWHIVNRKRGLGAPEVSVELTPLKTVTGYTRYSQQVRAVPYNLTYEVTVNARGDRAMSDAVKMQFQLSSICIPPGFGMKLLDSEGDERGYDVIVDGISPNLSALDLTDRDAGWTWTLVVHGELDYALPFETTSVYTAPQVSIADRDA